VHHVGDGAVGLEEASVKPKKLNPDAEIRALEMRREEEAADHWVRVLAGLEGIAVDAGWES
jgi:hypothetical protein